MNSIEQSVRGFADAMTQLRREPRRIAQLSAGAVERGRELSWDQKARRIADAYNAGVAHQAAANRAKAGS